MRYSVLFFLVLFLDFVAGALAGVGALYAFLMAPLTLPGWLFVLAFFAAGLVSVIVSGFILLALAFRWAPKEA